MTKNQQSQQQNQSIDGAFHDPQKIREILDIAAEDYNLVGSLTFGTLPEGFGFCMTTFYLTVDDTYDVGFGKRGLSRGAVERIAGAAGVNTIESKCTSSAKNYASYSVTVGKMDMDGSVRRATKSKVMDLRDGSGQVEAMRAAAIEKKPDGDGGAKQIREQRLHIGAHAETKAWLRAVRTLLALKTYTPAELQKPFAVPKIMFTGRTADPELRMLFAQGMMSAALGGQLMIYGRQPGGDGQNQLGAPPAPPQLNAGPPQGPPDFDDDDEDDAPPPPPRRAAPPAQGTATTRGNSSAGGGKVHEMKFGKNTGSRIDDPSVSDSDLAWYVGAIRKSISDPSKAQYKASNERIVAEIVAEQERRAHGEVGGGGSDPDEPHDKGDAGNYEGGGQ